jgi:hypothetical protein
MKTIGTPIYLMEVQVYNPQQNVIYEQTQLY